MRQNDPTTDKLLRIAEPVCTGAGYELVDLSLMPSREGWVLRVFIDHLPLPPLPLPPSPAATQDAATGPDAGDDDAGGAFEDDEERSEISFEDCERVSRELGAVLDVEDPIGHAYRLEVSSPGLDRPLRKLAHFHRFIGHEVKIKLHDGIDGRHNYKGTLLVVTPAADGTLNAVADTNRPHAGDRAAITLEVDGTQHELPFDDIESARLVPDWDAVMGKRPVKPGHS
ncbi:MAG TPA: ribosome maturation factor RimP [Haliangium sp.]|nr:ribosome maturation factor RimP [Haliangium sp.]